MLSISMIIINWKNIILNTLWPKQKEAKPKKAKPFQRSLKINTLSLRENNTNVLQ